MGKKPILSDEFLEEVVREMNQLFGGYIEEQDEAASSQDNE